VLAAVIIAVAFFGESLFGFGGGLIAIPLLSLFLGVRDAVTLVLIFQVATGLLIIKSYKHIDWKSAKLMMPLLVVGTIAGTLLLAAANTVFLQFFLALSIVLFLIKMVWFQGFTLGKKYDKVAGAASGLSGGLLQGLIGIGGPVITMYLSVVTPRKLALRATLIYLLFVICVVRLAISIPQDLFTTRIVELALSALPFFLVAIFLGQKFNQKISEKYYRHGVHTILACSSLLLFYKALV